MSSPTAARMKPMRMDTSDLSGLPPPSPMKDEKVRSWMAKNSGGPNLRAMGGDGGGEGGEEGEEEEGEEAADERRAEGRGEGLPSPPLPGERVAVEGGGHRPRLARDVEQDRGDGASKERAPVETGEEDDGGRRGHREGQGKKDGPAGRAAQPRG